jgi:dTDP-4-amino-4,6-dideoxygalactose transaminase
MYYLLLPTSGHRTALLADLAAHQIGATFHYVPLHAAPAARAVTDRFAECPVTDDISGRLVRLPFHNELSPADQDRVCSAVEGWMSANLVRRDDV